MPARIKSYIEKQAVLLRWKERKLSGLLMIEGSMIESCWKRGLILRLAGEVCRIRENLAAGMNAGYVGCYYPIACVVVSPPSCTIQTVKEVDPKSVTKRPLFIELPFPGEP